MHRASFTLVSIVVVLVGCTRPTAPTETPIHADDANVPKPSATPSEVPVDTGDPAACAKDADCDWDDPCNAIKCLRKTREPVGCDKSRPPPGTCTCISSACTLTFDPVPCKTALDCSWLDDPRRPVAASKVPRPKPPVKSCSDGTFDSVCTGGFCRIVVLAC